MYYFKPVFTFKGNDVERLSKYQRQLLIKEFTDGYNVITDVINDNLEKWNNEFEKAYPDLNGESNEYQKFMQDRVDNICKNYDNNYPNMYFRSSLDACPDGHLKKMDVVIIMTLQKVG